MKTPLFLRFQRQKQPFSRAPGVKIRMSGASEARGRLRACRATTYPEISHPTIDETFVRPSTGRARRKRPTQSHHRPPKHQRGAGSRRECVDDLRDVYQRFETRRGGLSERVRKRRLGGAGAHPDLHPQTNLDRPATRAAVASHMSGNLPLSCRRSAAKPGKPVGDRCHPLPFDVFRASRRAVFSAGLLASPTEQYPIGSGCRQGLEGRLQQPWMSSGQPSWVWEDCGRAL